MGGDLTVAIVVFLASAGVVMFCGAKLAVYGDALASLTGLGRLFVGSLLVALATSLPELSTNISAVRLDPPNPELAVGNVFGANMLNMFTMAAVALAFGGKRFLQQVAPEQGYLIVVAVVMTGAAILPVVSGFGHVLEKPTNSPLTVIEARKGKSRADCDLPDQSVIGPAANRLTRHWHKTHGQHGRLFDPAVLLFQQPQFLVCARPNRHN